MNSTFQHAVVWRSLNRPIMDMCNLWLDDSGWRLQGHVIAALGGQPVQVVYRVLCDEEWNTCLINIDMMRGAAQFQMQLTASNGTWFSRQSDLPELRGAHDVALDCTPAGLVLPLRRLKLAVGESADVLMACVRFPLMQVVPIHQTYTRTGVLTYHIESREDLDAADVEVDSFGFLCCHEGLWAAEATG